MERQEGHTPGRLRAVKNTGVLLTDECHVARVGEFRDKELLPFNRERWEADAARLASCWNALIGISTEALEKLTSLPAKERFGALSDIAKLHEMKEE